METILQRIQSGKFWQSPGGIHPPTRKKKTNSKAIGTLPVSPFYYVPTKQHIGQAGDVIVKVGQKVLGGQPLTTCTSAMTVPVHAPTSGKITSIVDHVSAHPSQIPTQTIVIKSDGKDEQVLLPELGDWHQCLPQAITKRIADAGISGLGGAGFPSHIKLANQKPIEFLIINAVECEPYITADDLLMQEKAENILVGIDILQKLVPTQHVLIGIEDDKPIAISTLKALTNERANIHVCEIPTKYPSGGEKQLIEILTGREVPSQGLPRDVGIVMHNVATVYAIEQAVCANKPLIERIVTLAGDGLSEPQNVWARLGTPVEDALAFAGYTPSSPERVIMGGPMMGFALSSLQVPVVKITNCLLAPTKSELPDAGPELNCIRCGACADACPASLLPQQLYWHAKANENDKLEEQNLFDCIECGICAAVCPSDIPLVEYYRVSKADIRATREEKLKAEQAKVRFEARQERLEREKEARKEKHRLAAEAREKSQSDRQKSSGKDAVAAALARVKEKKAGAGTDTAGADSSKSKAQAAIARAKAKKAAQQAAASGEPDNSAVIAQREARKQQARDSKEQAAEADDPRKAAVAAAVARAKAKKAAQANEQESDLIDDVTVDNQDTLSTEQVSETTTDTLVAEAPAKTDPKKAAVAAAIARAKAKKAAQQSEQQEQVDAPDATSAADAKKAKVAAAVARAKAKKEAQNTKLEKDKASASPSDDDKKAKVAAAIARAKAKKAQQQEQ